MKHLVEIGTGEVDRKGRGPRMLLIGDDPLSVAKCGATPGGDLAVKPGLLGYPVERFDAILTLAMQRMELPTGFVSASRALDHHGVTTLSPEPAHEVHEERIFYVFSQRDSHQHRGRS